MRYLIFSDLHSFREDNLNLISETFDYIILLGDIRSSVIIKILTNYPDKNAFGILGNHDDEGLYETVNKMAASYRKIGLDISQVTNLNGNRITLATEQIIGFEGAPGIKDVGLTITQETAHNRRIQKADTLFSHETGFHYFDNIDKTHEGFHVISDYIETIKPKYHIFGHHHKNLQFTKIETECFGVYGCSIFDSEHGTMKNIFDE